MSDVFISHVEEDAGLALEIARALEQAGLTTWYYERDSIPGKTYLVEVCDQIDQARAVVVLISPAALGSQQMTVEVVRGHESKKAFLPVLRGISHAEFQTRQPEWRAALGATTSIAFSDHEATTVLQRIVAGAKALCATAIGETSAPAAVAPPPAMADAAPGRVGDRWSKLIDRVSAGRPYCWLITGPAQDQLLLEKVRQVVSDEIGFRCLGDDDVSSASYALWTKLASLIRSAAFVIGDVSSADASVHFRLGYATGVNKPIVLLARSRVKIPPDLALLETIRYDTATRDDWSAFEDALRCMIAPYGDGGAK